MRKTLRFAPPHSIIAIADPSARDSPAIKEQPVRMWISSDTIIMGCFPSDDGETELTVSTAPEDASIDPPRADVQLPTPSSVIRIEQSDLTSVAQVVVPTTQTRIRIWSSDRLYPDKILVVIG